MTMEIKTISILGCGWFGLPFAEALIGAGYKVKGSTTSNEKLVELTKAGISPYLINLNETDNWDWAFFETDVLFIAVPPRAKTDSNHLYLEKMQGVAEAAQRSVKQVVFISSTGVFEDGNFEVDETHQPKPDNVSGEVLLSVEQMFVQNANFTTTIIRFAGLIGPNRNLAKFFAGKENVANGKAPINLITLDDCIGFCMQLIKAQEFGETYHAVTPHHPTREEFYSSLCKISGMQKPVFNDELLSWKKINTVYASDKLAYKFIVKNWFDWLDSSPTL
jgi:nucleoside-diphosphate-sugar epimerase